MTACKAALSHPGAWSRVQLLLQVGLTARSWSRQAQQDLGHAQAVSLQVVQEPASQHVPTTAAAQQAALDFVHQAALMDAQAAAAELGRHQLWPVLCGLLSAHGTGEACWARRHQMRTAGPAWLLDWQAVSGRASCTPGRPLKALTPVLLCLQGQDSIIWWLPLSAGFSRRWARCATSPAPCSRRCAAASRRATALHRWALLLLLLLSERSAALFSASSPAECCTPLAFC